MMGDNFWKNLAAKVGVSVGESGMVKVAAAAPVVDIAIPNRIHLVEAKVAGFFRLAKPMGWGLYRVEDIDGGLGSIWSIEKAADGSQFLVKNTDPEGEVLRKTAAAESRKYNQCDKLVGDEDKKCGKPAKAPGHRCAEHPMKKIWPGDDDEPETKTASAPPGEEKLVKKLKTEESVDNPWAVAWSIHNKKKAAAGAAGACSLCGTTDASAASRTSGLCAPCLLKEDAPQPLHPSDNRRKKKAAAGDELPEGTDPYLGEHGIGPKPADAEPDMDSMTKQYLATALWSSNDESDPNTGGDPLDQNYSIEDIHPASIERAKADCASFREKAGDLLVGLDDIRGQGDIMSSVGHDFWLTRNGHGAGFWDGDYPEAIGDALTKLSKEFGEQDIYVGDDGVLYLSGAEPPHDEQGTVEALDKQAAAVPEGINPDDVSMEGTGGGNPVAKRLVEIRKALEYGSSDDAREWLHGLSLETPGKLGRQINLVYHKMEKDTEEGIDAMSQLFDEIGGNRADWDNALEEGGI